MAFSLGASDKIAPFFVCEFSKVTSDVIIVPSRALMQKGDKFAVVSA